MDKNQIQIIEVNPEVISTIDRIDRSDWNYELYVSTGLEIAQVKDYSQWVLGKLAHEVSTKWGAIDDYAKAIRIARDSLYVYKFTYENFLKKFPDFQNDGRFPFGLLVEAGRSENPKETLEKFEDAGIETVEAARRHIIKEKTGEERSRRPKIGLSWNPELKLWDITFDEKDIPNINWAGIRSKIVNYIIEKKS